ncbi:Chromate resistance protein ChrB [Sphaerisporangium dianthi]|uniref:Chromate resistance protein ChrB n=1 Tax=Sphaerisporangium dianthi TaxID=1436120 RepID=A0ABV9CPD7_9ACTN
MLISVSTAGAAPTLRVQVWRKPRPLYSQQPVCLLHEREQTLRHRRRPLDRMLRLTITDAAEERQIIGESDAARDAEHAEVLERLPAFRQEPAAERARGRATYAEVEEFEADLERFRSWMAKIAARNYFAAPAGAAAWAAVEDAAADLAAFEQAALAAEGPADGLAGTIGAAEQEGGRR